MSKESNKVDYLVEDGWLILRADPNQDGEVVIEVKVSLKELPDEVIDLF